MNVKTLINAKKKSLSGLTRDQLEEYKRLSIWEHVFLAIYFFLFTGAALTGYGLNLHFSGLQIALIGASKLLLQSITPFAIWARELMINNKDIVYFTRLVSAMLMIFLSIVNITYGTFMDFGSFFVFFSIQATLTSVSTILRCTWSDSLIPQDERYSFSMKRLTIATSFGIFSCLLEGFFLDYLEKPFNFQLIMLLANVFNLLSIIPMQSQPACRCLRFKSFGLFEALSFVFNKLRSLSMFLMTFYAGVLVIDTLLFVHFIDDLLLSFTMCGIFIALVYLSSLYFTHRFKVLSGKFGVKNVVVFCIITMAVLIPLAIMISTPSFTLPIFFLAIIHGGCAGVVNSLVINLAIQLNNGEEPHKTSSGFSLLISLISAPSIVIGGVLLDTLDLSRLSKATNLQILPFHIVVLFGTTLILLSAIFLIRKIGPPESPFKQMVPHIIPTLFFFWKKPNFAEETEKSDHK